MANASLSSYQHNKGNLKIKVIRNNIGKGGNA